ncbi:hypothetical protein I553_8216 [Mycobacterium xenopi 4042]|uniref:Uncharacterized protein n=1 Tax=Mycobacterium xenopi 4042 TaxID=1299334 RepID=X8BIF5_MYCXE|nr:hypothetical protein I553_8216 [Mycobacterium xenopi 4042]
MDSAAADWAGSGLAYLTGPADGPPDFSRAGVLAKARHVTAEIARLLGVDTDAATILAGRAALLGLTRQGRVSAGGPRGSCPAPTAGARSRCRAPTTRPRCPRCCKSTPSPQTRGRRWRHGPQHIPATPWSPAPNCSTSPPRH